MSSAETRAEREFDYDRTVALSDGIFAIALTLLVLSIDFPRLEHPADADLWRALLAERVQLYSYAISFAVVALLWTRHHTFFRRLRRIDARMVALNLVYLGLVAFLPFPTNLLGDYGDHAPIVVFYAGTLLLITLVAGAMRRHATHAGLLPPEPDRRVLPHMIAVPLIFLASIPVAFASPTAAKLVWLALIVEGRLRWPGTRSDRPGAAAPLRHD